MPRYSLIGLLAIIGALLVLMVLPAYSQVIDAEPVIAPSSIWFKIWTVIQPIVVLLVSTVGPVLVTWIAARIIAVLNVTDEKRKLEIEAKLRDALHQSAMNGLKVALAKTGMTADLIMKSPFAAGDLLAVASTYVSDKNPDALKKLAVTPDALQDIILSKVTDLARKNGS
jgi:hypothetical protein